MEKGLKPFQASYEGIKEISFSILAISAMLLAVFIPVALWMASLEDFSTLLQLLLPQVL